MRKNISIKETGDQKMKCLIVVDMQSCFESAKEESLQRRIVEKIIEYKKRNEFIIILQFLDENDDLIGSVFEEIDEESFFYENTLFIGKHGNDGSEEIYKELGDLKDWGIDEFEICGVNLDACVLDTTIGLSSFYPDVSINILFELCGTSINVHSDAVSCCQSDIKYMRCQNVKLKSST
jgi:nicotinamidase-related amidase